MFDPLSECAFDWEPHPIGNILISKSMGAVLGAAMAFLPYLTIRLSDLNLAY